MTSDSYKPYQTLRNFLLALKPAGPDGFEGLVAGALSGVTGLVIRLAKSGSQFGRDASSGVGPFAVAMEAKRYDDNLRLEVLAGKVVLGGHVLEGKVDLWVLGATSEVGDDVERHLLEILDNYGVSLLVLDWTPRPLPPLAVLLASVRDVTLAWFAAHAPAVDTNVLAAQLNDIAASPSFPEQAAQMRQSLTAGNIGLDSLRLHTAEWLRKRFSSRTISQRSFGQFINISDPSSPALPRNTPAQLLRDNMFIDSKLPAVVAVLGGEGVGKTWLVAQWWAALNPAPILILVAGRRVDCLDSTEPVESLAKLLAQQQERSGESAVAGWRRRLGRWRNANVDSPLRFVVVLDGLNEHAGKPWADILKSLAPEVHALGGLVAITAREGFWRRDVAPRIRGSLNLRPVLVEGYNDAELSAVLARIGIEPVTLAPRVREFIRNPRVCTVALNLLNRLSLQPNELTVERLLLEYWHWRMEERGDLVGHNISDFEKLLRSHAQAWLDQPNRLFDRDEWTTHSGALRRDHGRNFRNDLTEIEEGRFLQVAPDDTGAYTFRQETLPFALGLLVNYELKSGSRNGNAHELLDTILEPVRGFDIMAEVVASAAGLACLDDNFPRAGQVALIRAWLGLQNIQAEALTAMLAYLPTRPEAFLDSAEVSEERAGGGDRQQFLLDLLIKVRDDPKVRPALDTRLPLWLGRWSRESLRTTQGAERIALENDRQGRISKALAELSPEERILFGRVCVEVNQLSALPLDRAAALLAAGRPQEHLASGFVGWAFAQAVAGDLHSAGEEIEWVVRLNHIDYRQTEAAIRRLVEPVKIGASEAMRRTSGIALNLLGTREAAELAQTLLGHRESRRWRRVEMFCNTNPYDPSALPGSNLDNARRIAAETSAVTTWNHMSSTMEDGNLEDVTPGLARFDPSVIINALREIARSVELRSDLSLRQLVWHLPELSPLFDSVTIRTMETAYQRLISNPTIVPNEDLVWIASRLVLALNPHLDAEAQLKLFLQMPVEVPEFLDLRYALKSLSAEALERSLETALTHADSVNLRRILFFASAKPPALTDRARQIIVEQVNNPDVGVACCASELVYRAQDHALNALVLNQAQLGNEASSDSQEELWKARALAMAIVQQKREDLLHLVAPRLLGFIAQELGGRALEILADKIERVLSRFLQPIAAPAPPDARLVVGISEDGLNAIKWIEDESKSNETIDLFSKSQDLSPLDSVRRFTERSREIAADISAFEAALKDEGAAELSLPHLDGLADLVKHEHERVARWLDEILNISDPRLLHQLHNLGVSLAGAYALHDGNKAAEVLRRLRNHPSPVTILTGEDRIPLYERALFSAPQAAAIDALREEIFTVALDDAALEAAVAAAESSHASLWLDAYADKLLGSNHPDDQARSLSIMGLRQTNTASDRHLTESWGPGFLGEVAASAAKNYRRYQWANHWLESTRTATHETDFWRFGTLVEGVADWRFRDWFEHAERSAIMSRFGDELYERLQKAAEKRTNKRKNSLFGLRVPDRDLRAIVLNRKT
jgi:hypothetical protein